MVKPQKLKFLEETKTIKKKITKAANAFKNYAHNDNVEILNPLNPSVQLRNTEFAIENKLKNLLNKLRGFKFVITLVLKLRKTVNEKEAKYSNSNSKIVIHSTYIDSVFESIYSTIFTKI